jgi:hypothetical protein
MKTFLEGRRDIIAIMDLALADEHGMTALRSNSQMAEISHFFVVRETYGCTVTANGDFYRVTITDRDKFQKARDTWALVISRLESNATPTI